MRSSVLMTVFLAPVLAVSMFATDNLYSGPAGDAYAFSSDEWNGGSYLGIDTRDITPDRLSALHLKQESGVEVTLVDQDAPAGKAGLKEHDVILTLNGTEVESVEQLRRMIHEIPPGREIAMGISRDGQPMTIKAQLAGRKKGYAYAYGPDMKDFKFVMPAMPAVPEIPAIPAIPDIDVPVSIVVVHSSLRSGLMVENLTPQLGDFLGAKNGQGVLVRSVEKGSRAEKAGFRAGDVIVRINGESIHDAGDFSHALRSRKDNTAAISLIRDKKEQTITLTLPERRQSDFLNESIEIPEIDAEAHMHLSQLQSEIAAVKPALAEAGHQIELMKPEIERQTKEFLNHQQDFKRQMRDMKRQLLDHQREIQKELREELQNDDEI
jgi:serine protease Do